jgi:hypothetical protein
MIAAFLDARTDAYLATVLGTMEARTPLVAGFLVGSGAAGGFDPERSDVDVVVVLRHALGDERRALVDELLALPCPVRDLQLVAYVEGSQPPDFELNLSDGEERPSEEPFWFVLDAALAQERAVPLLGPSSWSELFDPIPAEQVREAAAESLAWSERQPPGDGFARSNGVRARHYLEHGEWISKGEASR